MLHEARALLADGLQRSELVEVDRRVSDEIDEALERASSYLMARVTDAVPELPVHLLAAREAWFPFSPALLDHIVPTVATIADAVRSLIGQPAPKHQEDK